MALVPGSRLGPNEILAAIGAGGMGEVYRANDTRLKRLVAIKILPAASAADSSFRQRFQREVELLASLNHPHIAGIYGLEESDGVSALVMELVDGEDLSQRIARGAMPIDEALPIAKQIAEALEAAHAIGIIHRDLKPANVKVRADGTIKVLDFGLAKAMESAAALSGSAGQVPLSMSPTFTSPAMTQAGTILGTAAYMSPEQARGANVDRRADLWAVGVVLWEMLTGKILFGAATLSDTLAAVLKTEPDWSELPPDTPTAILRLLRRCLEKDRKRRLDSAADARLEIEESLTPALSGTSSIAIPARDGAHPASTRTPMLPWAVAGMFGFALFGTILVWAPWRTPQPSDRPLVRLDVDLGPEVTLPALGTSGAAFAISDDNSRVVYLSGTPRKLYARRLDQAKSVELAGTEGAASPFFSADGNWVGFASDNKVRKVSFDGGPVTPLAGSNSTNFAGGDWMPDGGIVYGEAQANGLMHIPSGGGTPEVLVDRTPAERALARPQVLPGGKAILFVATSSLGVDQYSIEVLTLADHHRKVIAQGGHSPRYLPTSRRAGHLVYVNKNRMFAVAFDPEALEVRGTPTPVVEDVAYEPRTSVAMYVASPGGTLVYQRGAVASFSTTIQWIDRMGTRTPIAIKAGRYSGIRLSPDGKRIALTVAANPNQAVSVYDVDRDTTTVLTPGGGFHTNPVWDPTGRFVFFTRYSVGIFKTRADGSIEPVLATATPAFSVPGSVNPDGTRLVYSGTSTGLWMLPLEAAADGLKSGSPQLLLNEGTNPTISPDGKWVAYQSTESGVGEVYVRAFQPPSSEQPRKWLVSNAGAQPRWSQNGHELIYQAGERIMAVGYRVEGGEFVADKPRVLVENLGGIAWDLAPDGSRIAVITPVDSIDAQTSRHSLVFVQNFFDELRRRAPVPR